MKSIKVKSAAESRRSVTCLTLSAMFAALIAAGTFISVPLPVSPVPVVLQNMFAVLSGLVLGPIYAACAVLLFLIAGSIGAPVFAGGSGGFVHFFGPTGGFLIGYLFGAVLCGVISGMPKTREASIFAKIRLSLACIAGFAIIYVPGVLHLRQVLDCSFEKAIAVGCIPFLPGDFVKAVAAIIISGKLRKSAARIF
ncbi:MAG: biotin transporter BioY [Termitinemataceae bacterium]|nr:MAG: biotin transporter BioY [Termitinemataceae bacterium]